MRAGVVLLSGDLIEGHQVLERWLPLVLAVWTECQTRDAKRFVIDLSNPNQFRITFGIDPKPTPPARGSSDRQALKRQRRSNRESALLQGSVEPQEN
jgi:hypothetical protein